MKPAIFALSIALSTICAVAGSACERPVSVCENERPRSLALIRDGKPVSVYVDAAADSAVRHVAADFADDLRRVSGASSKPRNDLKSIEGEVVIVGVLGQSPVIDRLVKAHKIDVGAVKGNWEAFTQTVIDNPLPGIKRALVIIGADRRGAVYGMYDISEKMGVSPWHWWADAPVTPKANLFVTSGAQSDRPKVRYRGIFINDEDPALKGWATKTFGGVNARMYENVFELTLRLKGNYIWPAMWGKAFAVDDPQSPKIADERGVVMGTSHHEPMMRAHKEWHLNKEGGVTGGKWDYATNASNLRAFWRGGIERMMSKPGKGGYESLVTVGMRGDGDEPMSEGTATELLEKIVHDQRQIIADVTKKPAEKTPQVWALYKEVQQYYDHGMKVPDDVTLLFADDNWGQIRRLPVAGQDRLDRKGGYGVYYHFDYVGAPRNYKWLNTNQIGKVWQQMDLAYNRGARNLWIVNVGDIKPMEYPLSFFMKMAWNPEQMTPEAMAGYPREWATEIFGSEHATEIGAILSEYSRLASRRKPELLDQNTYAIGEDTGPELEGGEFGAIVDEWQTLIAHIRTVKAKLPVEALSAYFQIVEYPTEAIGNLYGMYYAAAWNKRLASRNDARANFFADWVETAFQRDRDLTDQYHALNGGKWDGMINQVHMSYVIWNDPTQQTMPSITRVAGETPSDKLSVAPLFKSARTVRAADERVIEAVDYTRAMKGNGVEWRAINDLGHAKGAMISYPQGVASSTTEDNVRLDYDLDTAQGGAIRVRLVLSPTLDTSSKGGVRVGVSLDDGAPQILSSILQPTGGGANTPQEQAWYKAVIGNAEWLDATFEGVASGKHTLKIWRIDDNVVLQKLVIAPSR
ncbi:glycosyl hydrolase 115 family protein [Asticcacaulis sp. AND118]|uniref:glycosyl hydrolase 115 family protein n=1 Tax=Asticcacaulis sp. AND118 TaxID=2840468 RepID=UPI001CFF560D|nr:glycosyl hydrolase 115 family protein [Asticcacaulis sp. AND118]UDF03037.1 glycosyl hydrolase 115 family protein [Asticcacaulis sp. AND118]